MYIYQVKEFFESKKDTPCPITERLVKGGYQQRNSGYIKFAKKQGLEVDYSKALPTQWWHLLKSYCFYKEPKYIFPKSVQCGELLVWMAEVSNSVSINDLNCLVDEVLKHKNNRTLGNKIIKEMCFNKIVNTVETTISDRVV